MTFQLLQSNATPPKRPKRPNSQLSNQNGMMYSFLSLILCVVILLFFFGKYSMKHFEKFNFTVQDMSWNTAQCALRSATSLMWASQYDTSFHRMTCFRLLSQMSKTENSCLWPVNVIFERRCIISMMIHFV